MAVKVVRKYELNSSQVSDESLELIVTSRSLERKEEEVERLVLDKILQHLPSS